MKTFAFGLLVATGIVLDGLFLRALFGEGGGLGMALLHVLGSLAAGIGLAGLSPPRGQRGWLAVFWVASALFMPVVGIVGPLLAVLGSAWFPKAPGPSEAIVAIAHPDLPERGSQSPVSPRLGGASAFGRLRHSPSIVDRMDAIIALRGIEDRSAVPALKLALRDSADEVRLLAFTLLQERERSYYDEIHDRKGKLAAASVGETVYHLASIAQAYWELAYQDLVQGELLSFALEEAGKHLSEALRQWPASAGNTLLLGRIRLRQGRHAEAALLLDEARQMGLPDAVVKPHQAEAAFLVRDFKKTRALLAQLPPQAKQMAVIGDLARFWA
jgi:hypothetical protein